MPARSGQAPERARTLHATRRSHALLELVRMLRALRRHFGWLNKREKTTNRNL
jgi:hypothetical protein